MSLLGTFHPHKYYSCSRSLFSVAPPAPSANLLSSITHLHSHFGLLFCWAFKLHNTKSSLLCSTPRERWRRGQHVKKNSIGIHQISASQQCLLPSHSLCLSLAIFFSVLFLAWLSAFLPVNCQSDSSCESQLPARRRKKGKKESRPSFTPLCSSLFTPSLHFTHLPRLGSRQFLGFDLMLRVIYHSPDNNNNSKNNHQPLFYAYRTLLPLHSTLFPILSSLWLPTTLPHLIFGTFYSVARGDSGMGTLGAMASSRQFASLSAFTHLIQFYSVLLSWMSPSFVAKSVLCLSLCLSFTPSLSFSLSFTINFNSIP